MPRGRGFSVQHGGWAHRSLTGLPGPKNVQRGIVVTVRDEAAGEADMGPHAQGFGHALPTPATVLRRVGGVYHQHLLASVHCFAGKDSPKLAPARIRDAFAEASVPH